MTVIQANKRKSGLHEDILLLPNRRKESDSSGKWKESNYLEANMHPNKMMSSGGQLHGRSIFLH